MIVIWLEALAGVREDLRSNASSTRSKGVIKCTKFYFSSIFHVSYFQSVL